ncbi:type II toxin-antitoxin system antitoxin, RelB/DinJ family [Lactobacillus sp. CBA3605]|uniref:type II toxin-antitoxin system RelB/DinJ family antitoxin n=1 Tax=Lactobacillus sp. CBA3605 TaxID=2099788 RepID=UPI000CFC6247|nr:type II toxin-antitoxin system RelB/DinJ family antitoxin [Lactobacillus sp. CBA3605]AVK62347.1 type II toxin-antitoxin system antitoxin, RelB/DinJ family [Lactobacillus sp. CBA3605]
MSRKVTIELDQFTVHELEDIFKVQGLTPEQAFQLFVAATISTGRLPFRIEKPTERLKAALASTDYAEYNNAKEGLKALLG